MKTMRFIAVGMLLCHTAASQTIAPQTVNTTGGSNRKGNIRLDYSVGEMALVNTLSSPTTGEMITNGLIQPEGAVVKKKGKNEMNFKEGEIRILPNPTRDLLTVGMNMSHEGTVTIRLFDVLGNLLYKKEMKANRHGQMDMIDMSGYIKGHYMLKVELVASGYKYKEGFYKIIKVE